MASQAWAQNAVITRDDGSYVKFRPRCPRCGHVPINQEMGGSARERVRANYSARCSKCGENFQIVLSRG